MQPGFRPLAYVNKKMKNHLLMIYFYSCLCMPGSCTVIQYGVQVTKSVLGMLHDSA